MYIKKKINDQDLKILVDSYNSGSSIKKSAGLIGVSERVASRILKENNIQIRNDSDCHRKYELDETFFDDIDTEEKAYFFGWLMADGHNHELRHTVSLKLKHSDYDILETLSRLIYKNGRVRKGKKLTGIDITSKRISQRLSEMGCMQAKTFKIRFPFWMKRELWKHFIRGYFDGDGCLCNYTNTIKSSGYKYRKSRLSIISNEAFCNDLQSVTHKLLGFKGSIVNKDNHTKNKGTKEFALSSKSQIIEFCKMMYENSTIQLERKYEKFKELNNEYDKYKEH